MPKKPYFKRSDQAKLQSNWNKTIGLYEREEWSMAIVRAATCTEIAANILIRAELTGTRGLDPTFVNHLLHWANGIDGKFVRLILPLFAGTNQRARLVTLHNAVRTINDTRNAIIHSGRFAGKPTALRLLTEAREVCHGLANGYCSPPLKLRAP